MLRTVALAMVTLWIGCADMPPEGHDEVYTVVQDRTYEPAPKAPAAAPAHAYERLRLPQHPDIDTAWAMLGGQGAPPRIKFMYGAALNCPEGGERYVLPNGACVGGHYDYVADVIYVTIPDTWWRLAHEMRHAEKFKRTGDSDTNHGGHGGWDIRTMWDRAAIEPVEQFLLAKGWR